MDEKTSDIKVRYTGSVYNNFINTKDEVLDFVYAKKNNNLKFVIYGTDVYEYYNQIQSFFKIDFFIDDSNNEKIKKIFGTKVLKLYEVDEVLKECDTNDYRIIVFSKEFRTIIKHLTNLGFNPIKQVFDGYLLFNKEESMPNYGDIKKLIFTGGYASNNTQGGVFIYDLEEKALTKKIDGNFRGMCRYQDGYLCLDDNQGLLYVDSNFKVSKKISITNADLHGISIYPKDPDHVFIAETAFDRIGIYNLETCKKEEEILIGLPDSDKHHINDIFVTDKCIYISMLSLSGIYGSACWKNDGAIVELNRKNYIIDNLIASNLNAPHTIYPLGRRILFCDSYKHTVNCDDEVVCNFNSFTRGIYYDGYTLFVGQSKPRHIVKLATNHRNISYEAGIHCYWPAYRLSAFIPINATEQIYSILV